MDFSKYEIVPLSVEHITPVTLLWREAMSAAIGIAPIHSFESQAYFLEHIIAQSHRVWVVTIMETSKPVAFIACSEEEVNQLYVNVAYQGLGMGKQLLDIAKEQSNGLLTLRTFEINKRAQRFYRANGFAITDGNSDNEENLPDLVCTWVRGI